MLPAEARPTARMVLGYFGADATVLDNKLSSDDRDRFYQLEEEGLLTSEEEDATVSRGKTWRIHYWLLRKGRIRDVGQGGDVPPTDEAEATDRAIRGVRLEARPRGSAPEIRAHAGFFGRLELGTGGLWRSAG